MGNCATGTELRLPPGTGPRHTGPATGLLVDEERPNDDNLRASGLRRGSAPDPQTPRKRSPLLASLGARPGIDFASTYPTSLLDALREALGPLRSEQLVSIYLDQNGRYLFDETIESGSAGQITGTYRKLIERAFDANATAMIVAHNHPSGDPRPSAADVHFTRALSALAQALEIRLHDHMIVTWHSVFSMKRGGLVG